MKIDFGRTSADYGRFRAGFPDEIFERLARVEIGVAGQKILDLGTGTGSMARGFSRRGATVLGLDAALAQLREARKIDAQDIVAARHIAGGTEREKAGARTNAAAHSVAGRAVQPADDAQGRIATRYVAGRAERLPCADRALDVVSAGQCWRWFDAPSVLTEVRRVLGVDGRLVIATFDWLPLPGSVSSATEDLIHAHNPAWDLRGGDGIHEEWLPDLAAAGFTRIEGFFFDTNVPYSHAAWRGRIRASAGIGASLDPERVRAFDDDHAAMLARDFKVETLAVPHRTFVIITVGTSGGAVRTGA